MDFEKITELLQRMKGKIIVDVLTESIALNCYIYYNLIDTNGKSLFLSMCLENNNRSNTVHDNIKELSEKEFLEKKLSHINNKIESEVYSDDEPDYEPHQYYSPNINRDADYNYSYSPDRSPERSSDIAYEP